MYLTHLATVTVAQNSRMPSISSCLLLGFTSLRMYSLSSCQTFSIGLQSGDSGGVFHQFMECSSRKCPTFLEVCIGALSCMNRHCGRTSRMNGRSVCCSTSMYRSAFMIPSNMQTPVAPFLLMPAQTCTFTGCFGLQEKTGEDTGTVNFKELFVANWKLINTCNQRSLGVAHYHCKRLHVHGLPGFVPRWLAFSSTAEPTMSLELDSTLVGPQYVLKPIACCFFAVLYSPL